MSIEIKLNKPDNRYIAGELLQGSVTLSTPKDEKVRSIYILIKGASEVRWTVQESYQSNGKTQHRSVTYSSHEQYLNSETVLFGSIEGPTIKFPAGEHQYNFACALPERLPGSMKTSEAEIKYKVKLVMDIPWGIDETKSLEFQVVNVIDLNQNGVLQVPVQIEERKSFCFCSCRPHEAVVTITLPQGGYVPNEIIPIQCYINNKTTVEFYSATFKLVRVVTATAVTPRHRTRDTTDKLAEEEHTIEPDTKNTVTEFTTELKVPVCPVSCHYAAYIHTDYCIEAEIFTSGCHANVTMRLPIEIGTIPLGVPGYSRMAAVPLAPMSIEGGPVPSAPVFDLESGKVPLAEAPPPSYADVTKGSEKNSHMDENIGWNVK